MGGRARTCGARRHAEGPQPRRLHALLLLPVAGPGAAARLVQVAPYRSRAVLDPRGVLREFGVEVGTTSRYASGLDVEMRYLVLPERPAGTEGMSEEALASSSHATR